MRKLLYILFFIPLNVFATNYYVKNGGNDNASGTSDAEAWATITKVNGASLSAGDTVFFKRNDTWRRGSLSVKSGSLLSPIVYTAYGSGAKPLFLGSKQENSTSDWADAGGNLWENADQSFSLEVCNLIFNNEESCGVRVKTLNEVNSQGKWFYDYTNKKVVLYSTQNPATYYSNIECSLDLTGFRLLNTVSNVIIDGFDIKYYGYIGIETTQRNENVIIRNNYVSFIGGRKTNPGGTLRLGNGIQIWYSAKNITIERNIVKECYDAGITSQYLGAIEFEISDITIRNNIIERCDFGIEWWYWNSSTGDNTPLGDVDNFIIQNNIIVNSGNGWYNGQKWGNIKGSGIVNSWKAANLTNCYIRNNIFYGATQYAVYTYNYWLNDPEIVWDYNLFGEGSKWWSGGNTYTTLNNWQTFSGNEQNSISANPLLNSDYTLQSLSPAIDAGVDVGYTYDYLGNPVPNGTHPDMGAIEYYDEYPPIEPVIVTTIRPYWTSESTAVAGGSVTSTGGGTVSVRGVCWNTTGTPTTSDSKTEDGSGTGAYISLMTGLNNTLTYYVRAYAINEAGTSYGEELLFRKGILLIDPATGKPLVKDNKFITR